MHMLSNGFDLGSIELFVKSISRLDVSTLTRRCWEPFLSIPGISRLNFKWGIMKIDVIHHITKTEGVLNTETKHWQRLANASDLSCRSFHHFIENLWSRKINERNGRHSTSLSAGYRINELLSRSGGSFPRPVVYELLLPMISFCRTQLGPLPSRLSLKRGNAIEVGDTECD